MLGLCSWPACLCGSVPHKVSLWIYNLNTCGYINYCQMLFQCLLSWHRLCCSIPSPVPCLPERTNVVTTGSPFAKASLLFTKILLQGGSKSEFFHLLLMMMSSMWVCLAIWGCPCHLLIISLCWNKVPPVAKLFSMHRLQGLCPLFLMLLHSFFPTWSCRCECWNLQSHTGHHVIAPLEWLAVAGHRKHLSLLLPLLLLARSTWLQWVYVLGVLKIL